MNYQQIVVLRLGLGDDLDQLVADVAAAEWDGANEMEPYDLDALREYLGRDDNVLLVARINDELAGLLLACKIYAPYKNGQWMYVDEVDVAVNHRRKGVGGALMKELFAVAKGMGLKEAWLGTEPDNISANKLYRSLGPSSSESFVDYTFRL